MAQLIKIRHQPQKWLLKKKLMLKPINHLFAYDVLKSVKLQLDTFDHERSCSRDIIKEFYLNRNHYVASGTKRGIKRYKTQLAFEILKLATKWRLNIVNESLAIDLLAHKVAVNITNDPKLHNSIDAHITDIESALQKSFSLLLLLPSRSLETIRNKHKTIIDFFGQSFLRAHQQDMGAQIALVTKEISLQLEFDETNLERILCDIEKVLSHSTNQ